MLPAFWHVERTSVTDHTEASVKAATSTSCLSLHLGQTFATVPAVVSVGSTTNVHSP